MLPSAVARLWAQGLVMSSEAAVALVQALPPAAASDADRALTAAAAPGADWVLSAAAAPDADRALSAVAAYEVAAVPPRSLTPREHQVAALVAVGASNKTIAAELSISPTTAARHVANILAKLGFSSRTQIAAWVADKHSVAARADATTRPT